MTMMVVETASVRGAWTAGGSATVRGLVPARQPYIGSGRQFGGNHPGGAMDLFADGYVRFLSDSTKPKVFEAMASIAGGERVDKVGDD